MMFTQQELRHIAIKAEAMVDYGINADAFSAIATAATQAAKWIDPPRCGCTDCITGYSRPADNLQEYQKAKKLGLAR